MTNITIHSQAVVLAQDIGEGTTIGPFTVIEQGASIGRGCTIGPGSFIQEGSIIRDGCILECGVVVLKGVTLEDDVFLGSHVVFTNVITPRAKAYPPQPKNLRTTKVGRGSTLNANTSVLCGHIIGPYAVVGAGSTVIHSVRAHEIVHGVPAQHGGWACECGEKLHDIRECPVCGRQYEMIDLGLRRL